MLKPTIEELLTQSLPVPTIRDILNNVEVVALPKFGLEPSPIAAIHTAMLAPSTVKQNDKEI